MAEDAAAGSSADAALVESKGTTLVDGGTSIPPGLRVTWSERQDRLSMMLEVVEPEDPCVSLEDSGQVSIEVLSNEVRYAVRLQLRSQIDAHRSRWSASGRGWRASPCTWHPPRLPTRMMCRRQIKWHAAARRAMTAPSPSSAQRAACTRSNTRSCVLAASERACTAAPAK